MHRKNNIEISVRIQNSYRDLSRGDINDFAKDIYLYYRLKMIARTIIKVFESNAFFIVYEDSNQLNAFINYYYS